MRSLDSRDSGLTAASALPECLVFTFKEGLLSAIAHDLKIRVASFALRVSEGDEPLSVEADFDATSLEVETAMQSAVEAPSLLGASDKEKIRRTIQADVLETNRFSRIGFRSTEIVRASDGQRATVQGDLTLHGRTRNISFVAEHVDGRWIAEIPIHQPDFGIKPYTAMLGTLRIKPDLRVRIAFAS